MKVSSLFAAALMLAPTLASAADCSRDFINASTQVFHFRGQTIALVGWSHNVQSDYEKLSAGLSSISNILSSKKNCKSASEIANSTLMKVSDRLKETELTISYLDDVMKKFSIRKLALETPPSEAAKLEESWNAARNNTIAIGKLCPDLYDEIDNIYKVYIGPAKYLKSVKPNIIAVEDENLYKLSLDQLNKIDSLPDQQVRLSPYSEGIIDSFARSNNLSYYGTSELESIIANVRIYDGSTPDFSLIEDTIRARNEINRLGNERNVAIVRNLTDIGSSVALLIGMNHIEGLVEELQTLCYRVK